MKMSAHTPDMKRYFVKDLKIECPNCDKELSIKELINKGEFDEYSFSDNAMPEWFNPFDNSHPDWFNERLSLPFDCRCPHCKEYLEVRPALRIFAVDVIDKDMDVVASLDTELIE